MSWIDTLYIIFLATGFSVGFGHCIGMCGPIAVSISLGRKKGERLFAHLFYNLGRILTYGLLGGVMGTTGAFAQVTAAIAGLQKAAMIFAGGLIIVLGLAMSGWVPLGRIFGKHLVLNRLAARTFKRLSGLKSAFSFLPAGLVLGLLPCGPVYTALIAAAGAGMNAASTLEGMTTGILLMLCFGIGTLPALAVVARLAAMGWLPSRAAVYQIGSLLMIIVGVYYVVQAIRY